jgi:hypothetical protein
MTTIVIAAVALIAGGIGYALYKSSPPDNNNNKKENKN